MMNYKEQLKLQAYLDGELSEGEMRSVAERLARDQEAAALVLELRRTREAFSGFGQDVKLPESREFYWSKIQREIRRLETPARAAAKPNALLAGLRAWLRPAMAFAVVAVLGLVLTREGWPGSSPHPTLTSLEDSSAFTYHDNKAGVTLVWLSYPAEKVMPGEDEGATLE
jgi:anti-sigma-K factor RskA